MHNSERILSLRPMDQAWIFSQVLIDLMNICELLISVSIDRASYFQELGKRCTCLYLTIHAESRDEKRRPSQVVLRHNSISQRTEL